MEKPSKSEFIIFSGENEQRLFGNDVDITGDFTITYEYKASRWQRFKWWLKGLVIN